MSKWSFNSQETGDWCYGIFDTMEEAVAEGMEYAKELSWSELFIGEVVEVPIGYSIDADSVIEHIAENIEENHGGDWGADQAFLDNIGDKDTECLQKILDDALEKWVNERNISSHVFNLKNIERIELKNP